MSENAVYGLKYIYILFEFKRVEFFTSHGGYLLNTTPGVRFSVAGRNSDLIDLKVFYCCHSDIDFAKTCILTNFNS